MRWIKLVKEQAWKEKVPIPVELADLLNKSHGELGAEVEFAGIHKCCRIAGWWRLKGAPGHLHEQTAGGHGDDPQSAASDHDKNRNERRGDRCSR